MVILLLLVDALMFLTEMLKSEGRYITVLILSNDGMTCSEYPLKMGVVTWAVLYHSLTPLIALLKF